MNQELKHRLIGAVVITALAAIFIPMLFDDPVDDTGQLVSEQTIPAEPAQTAEGDAGKAPSSIDQVLATPDGESEPSVNGQGSMPEPGDNGMESVGPDGEENGQNDADALNQSPISDGMDSGTESFAEEEMSVASDESENDPSKQDQQPGALDTGIIDDANQKSAATDKAVDESEEYRPSPAKPSTGSVAAPVKNTPRDTESKPAKSSASVAAEEPKKPVLKAKETPKKSGQELVRWYLQAGSFSRKENALTLFETLRKQELPVVLETVQVNNGVLYRLKVGPELSRKRAADIKAKLEKQKIKSMLISE
jgi:DedD protein